MEKHPVTYYLEKYSLGTITTEEWQELRSLVQGPDAVRLEDFVKEQFELADSAVAEQDAVIAERFVSAWMKKIEAEKRPAIRAKVHFLQRWWVAASLLLLVGAGVYIWYHQNRSQQLLSDNILLPADIEPGKEGAILTLADGTPVVLDSFGNGMIAMQGGTQVMLQDGRLTYDPTAEAGSALMYNTMTTPKGRQFNLWLPDGTRVWLNAESSLRYPTNFFGGERRVEISGEAYFEVAKNAKQPFRVDINGLAEVEVLGTHFNINAYADERSIQTTLLEGSIKVLAGRQLQPGNDISSQSGSPERPAVTLRPGQQAQLTNTLFNGRQSGKEGIEDKNAINVINEANIEKVMAWKNGLFNFNNIELEEVMRQLERWYDIEVIYEDAVPEVKLRGKMTRGVTLNGLLKNLGKMGVHSRLEGRRLTILP